MRIINEVISAVHSLVKTKQNNLFREWDIIMDILSDISLHQEKLKEKKLTD